jgi:hypothetical protein
MYIQLNYINICKKLDPHILQNEIILSNFDDFLIYLDSVIKKVFMIL